MESKQLNIGSDSMNVNVTIKGSLYNNKLDKNYYIDIPISSLSTSGDIPYSDIIISPSINLSADDNIDYYFSKNSSSLSELQEQYASFLCISYIEILQDELKIYYLDQVPTVDYQIKIKGLSKGV